MSVRCKIRLGVPSQYHQVLSTSPDNSFVDDQLTIFSGCKVPVGCGCLPDRANRCYCEQGKIKREVNLEETVDVQCVYGKVRCRNDSDCGSIHHKAYTNTVCNIIYTRGDTTPLPTGYCECSPPTLADNITGLCVTSSPLPVVDGNAASRDQIKWWVYPSAVACLLGILSVVAVIGYVYTSTRPGALSAAESRAQMDSSEAGSTRKLRARRTRSQSRARSRSAATIGSDAMLHNISGITIVVEDTNQPQYQQPTASSSAGAISIVTIPFDRESTVTPL